MSETKPPLGNDNDELDDELDLESEGSDPEDLEGLDELIEAVASSAKPRAIDPDVHEALLARALGISPATPEEEAAEPPATAAEVEWGARLCRALELTDAELETALQDARESDVVRLAALARALKLAFAPRALDDLSGERLLRPALKQPSRRQNARMIYGAVAVVMTLAAAFAGLYVKSSSPSKASARLEGRGSTEHMTQPHSTEALFEAMQPFPREGGTTERIDKIAESRAGDLRDNRFQSWGIE